MLDQSTLRIQEVNDLVSEPLVARCKDGHFIVLVDELQALAGVRPEGEPSVDVLACFGVSDFDLFFGFEMAVDIFTFVDALVSIVSLDVDEGLVQVEDEQFLETGLLELKVYPSLFWELLVFILHELFDFVDLQENILDHVLILR